MSPAHHRYVFIGFTLLIAGVAANVMVLQPAPPADGAGRAATAARAEAKAELERRQRLALDRQTLAATAPPTALTSVTLSPPAQATIGPGLVKPALKVEAVKAGAPTQDAQTPFPMEQGPRRFARLRPDSAHANRAGDRLPDAPDAEGDPETIKAVQRELASHGYGQLSADGVPGLVTRAAIMAFEYDQHLPLTGEATERVLARLLLGPMGATGSSLDPAAGHVRSPQAELVMRTVQQSLAALGYQVGRIDGKPGDDIARAIREFELDEGLKPTGRVSAEVFSRLGRVVAAAKPKPIQ